MIEFKKAINNTDFQIIENLASTIWREHYTKIIGEKQVVYMLNTFQSRDAISKQIDTGYQYYIINFNRQPVGYISIKEEKNELFLSKLYLLNTYRGKKIGQTTINFIENIAKNLNLKYIKLTVNKNNFNSIKVYERLGFNIKREVVIDIGNGFVMDDYEMVKTC